MVYTNNEKSAIVCLLIELINVDDKIDPEEQYTLNEINAELGIDQSLFDAGKEMSCDYAMTVVSHMTDEKKMDVASLMVRMIDCDGVTTDDEIRLLNKICKTTGLDNVINDLTKKLTIKKKK